jgi:hypothetical protein
LAEFQSQLIRGARALESTGAAEKIGTRSVEEIVSRERFVEVALIQE